MIRAVAIAVAAALVAVAAPASAALLAHDGADEREIRAMQVKSPHALDLLNQGEAKAAAGSLKEAQALFEQAHTENIDFGILWRRDCEMLTELGRRPEAVRACSTAIQDVRSANNMRALVSAFVDGPEAPTTSGLAMALLVTATERHKGMSLRVAAAACDISERIGDVPMLQRCTEELERIDPNDPATRQARAALESQCPPWRFWLGWGAIAAVLAATLGHAALRLLRRRSGQAGAVAAAAVALLAGSAPAVARADDPPAASRATAPDAGRYGHKWLSKWAIDDAHPDSNIPAEKDRDADPLQFGYWLQDLVVKGDHAAQIGDHVAAAHFFETLGKAVPDRAIGFIKACDEYEAAGEIDTAIERCGEALLREGLQVKDYTHFAKLVIGKPGKLSDKEKGALTNLIAHMREDPAGRPFVDDLECQVGVRTTNVAQLRECTAALVQKAPDDPKTIVYQWNLAFLEGTSSQAENLLERAQAAGVAPAEIEKMRAATTDNSMRRYLRRALVVLAAGLLVGALGVALRANAARKRVEEDPAAVKG